MSRARSATFTTSICTWAAAVQPGTPAPPTPATSKSTYTPSSAHQFDLTALGYTSVFVHLPTTPSTPDAPTDASPSKLASAFSCSRARSKSMSNSAFKRPSGPSGGGKLDKHMARAVGQGAVADGQGAVWWDEEEYEPLLPKEPVRKDKKRRPAPLNLAQQEFLATAFVPPPSAPFPAPKKTGKMNVRAFFPAQLSRC
ncbi:hypothetical protein BDZ89DRAFT_1071706, partial [Hymenopellis radicata]